MSNRSIGLSDVLQDYLLRVSLREADVLRRLRAETATHPQARMQIAPEQGQFMALLTRLMGARKALEVGVFTGYSALSVALALPDDGQLVACDLSADYTALARRYWAEAGVAHKIDLRLAPATETLDQLLAHGEAGTFDLMFIDADKPGYDAYYERGLHLLRPGGLMLLDNMFMDGAAADPHTTDENARAIHRLNEKLHDDPRIDLSLLPLADGVALVRKQ